jgi:DNA-binding NarL/FixJ family response regulator
MDVNLPDVSGVECVEHLAPQLPGTQIVMLTVYQDPDTIFRALAAGAHGYMVKPIMPEKLLEAIREIHNGGAPMSRTIARKVIDAFRRPTPASAVETAMEDASLGMREQQVLEFLVAGYSYKEIAQELDIKVSTVGTYVQRIYEKLHVHSRREVISRYMTKPSPADAAKS